jgi:predicted nucleic acid-binding protein
MMPAGPIFPARAAVRRCLASRGLLRRVEADDASWQLVPLSDEIVAAARVRALQQSLRTLDAIHLASAEALHREGLRIPFVTSDARQAATARTIGLDVVAVGL